MRQRAWLFDVDGTLALRKPGGRGPYDWDRVDEDEPNEPVFAIARSLLDAGDEAVFASGRNEVCHYDTTWFIHKHLWDRMSFATVAAHLHLRPDTDEWRYAKDVDLKRWLYRDQIEPLYEIAGVFDDRDQVVRLWREELQLPTFQVSNGNF